MTFWKFWIFGSSSFRLHILFFDTWRMNLLWFSKHPSQVEGCLFATYSFFRAASRRTNSLRWRAWDAYRVPRFFSSPTKFQIGPTTGGIGKTLCSGLKTLVVSSNQLSSLEGLDVPPTWRPVVQRKTKGPTFGRLECGQAPVLKKLDVSGDAWGVVSCTNLVQTLKMGRGPCFWFSGHRFFSITTATLIKKESHFFPIEFPKDLNSTKTILWPSSKNPSFVYFSMYHVSCPQHLWRHLSHFSVRSSVKARTSSVSWSTWTKLQCWRSWTSPRTSSAQTIRALDQKIGNKPSKMGFKRGENNIKYINISEIPCFCFFLLMMLM